jgi:hypothetical protein
MAAASAGMGIASSYAQGQAAGQSAYEQSVYNAQMAQWRNDRFQSMVDYQQKVADWQEERYYKTAASATESARGQYSTVLEQVDQVRNRTLHSIANASRQAQKGRSFTYASSSETGTGGSSIRLAQQQYELAEARHTYIAFENLKGSLKQSERNLMGINAQAQNRINQAMPAPMAPIDPVQPTQQVSQPSMLPYLIQGGSAIVGAAAWQQGIDAQWMDTADYANSWGNSWWSGSATTPVTPPN